MKCDIYVNVRKVKGNSMEGKTTGWVKKEEEEEITYLRQI